MENKHQVLETFNKYLGIIETNIVRAAIYLKLHRKIEEYLNQQKASGKQGVGRVFLAEVRTAFSQTGMLLLAKVYDTHKDSIGLEKILNCAEANSKHWHLQELERRKFQDELISCRKKIDEENSSLVKKLVAFRNKVIAHPGNDEIKRERRISETLKELDLSQEPNPIVESIEENLSEKSNPLSHILWNFLEISDKSYPYSNFPRYLTWEEVDELLDLAIKICSKYKRLANSGHEAETLLENEIESGVQELLSDFESLCERT